MRNLLVTVTAIAVLSAACARNENEGTNDESLRGGVEGLDVLEPSIEVMKSRAERGDVEAQHFLGSAYTYGDGVPQDYSEAVRWHRLAAEQGHRESQFALAAGYSNGIDGVIPQDHSEAIKWMERAAQQGQLEATMALAWAHFEGQFVEQDYAAAYKWYLQAAEQGNPVAQTVLARLYFQGKGVTRDLVEAYKWIIVAFGTEADLDRGDEKLEKIVLIRVQIWSEASPDERAAGEELAMEWLQTREPH